MGKSILMKFMATICTFLFCSGIAGVYAFWSYPLMNEEDTERVELGLTDFLYKPEEVLPDEEEDSEQQRNLWTLFGSYCSIQKWA